MEKINYYLVLEKRKGDYNLIDINRLDICNYPVSNDIASIDNFTLNYSEKEIIDSIARSNMANIDYLKGQLKIISDVKHNLEILSKDKFNNIVEFQNDNSNIIDQNLKNKIFSKYRKIINETFEDKDFIKTLLERFKNSLKNNNKREIFKLIEELPYNKIRNIYLIIHEYNLQKEVLNNENENKVVNIDDFISKKEENLRILEKINDAA